MGAKILAVKEFMHKQKSKARMNHVVPEGVRNIRVNAHLGGMLYTWVTTHQPLRA